MPVTINGSTGITDADGGVVLSTADFASQAEAEAGTDNTKLMTPLRADQAILAQLNVTGSAPTFACRAWVNFSGSNGAISASGNVTSVTKNSTGTYTINFTTAMPDANYAALGSAAIGGANYASVKVTAFNTTYVQVTTSTQNSGNPVLFDPSAVCVTIFR